MPFHTRKWDFLRGVFDDLSDIAHESADWIERYPYEYWRQVQTYQPGPTLGMSGVDALRAFNPLAPLVGSLSDTAGEEAAALANRYIHPDYQIDPKDMSNIIRGVSSVAPGMRTTIPNFYNSARSFFNRIKRSTPKHIQTIAELPQNRKLLNDLKESGAWEKIIALPPNESINTADLPYYPPEMIFDVQSTDPTKYGPRVETTSYLSDIADAGLQTEAESGELHHQADELYTDIFGGTRLSPDDAAVPFWKAGHGSILPTQSGTGYPNFRQIYGGTGDAEWSEFLKDRGISSGEFGLSGDVADWALENDIDTLDDLPEEYDSIEEMMAIEVLKGMGNQGWIDHVAVKLGIGPDRHSINFEDPFDDKGFFGIPMPPSFYDNRKVKYLYDRVRDRGIDPEGKSVIDLINLEATTTVPMEERYLGTDLQARTQTDTARGYLELYSGDVQKAYDGAREDFLRLQELGSGADDPESILYAHAKVTQQLGEILESGVDHVPTKARHTPNLDVTTGGPLKSGETNYRELVVKYKYPSESDRSKLGIGEVDLDAHFGPGTVGWARTTDKYISSADEHNMPEDLWMKAQSEGYSKGIATSHLDEIQSEHQKAAGIRKNNVDREILGDLLKNYDIYLWTDFDGDILSEIAEIRIKPGFHRPAFYAKQQGETFSVPSDLEAEVFTDADGGQSAIHRNQVRFLGTDPYVGTVPLDSLKVQITEQMLYEANMINRDSGGFISVGSGPFVRVSNKVTDAIKKATENSDLLDVIKERQKIAREKYPLEYAYRELGVDYDTAAMRRFTDANMWEPVLENAPYKTEWLNIAVKNFLWDAAVKGNDYISWSSPEFLKDRWSGDTASKEGGLFDVVYGTQLEKLIRKELKSLSVEREGVPVRIRTYKGQDHYIIEFPKDIRDALIEKGQDPEKGFELSKLRKKLEEAYA